MGNSDEGVEHPLVCAECGVESPPDAADWRAYLDDDGRAVTFCPDCPERVRERLQRLTSTTTATPAK
jgi:hypothetical protein